MLRNWKFKTKLILANTLLVLVVMVFGVGSFYSYFSNIITGRSLSDFGAITGKTTQQFDTLLYNMDKLALQIAANPTVVNTFGKIERDVPGNYFIREPVVRSQMLFLLDSYNFKRDSNSRVFLYNDWGDFIYSASVMTTNSACEAFLAGEDFEKTKQSFSQEGYYVRYKPPQADDMNDSPTL